MHLPKDILNAINIVNDSGYDAFVVGGSVRDSILGVTSQDFDIATDMTPKQSINLFTQSGYKVIETGIQHGTVTVIFPSHHVEITTYRIDGSYENNRWPKAVTFTNSLKEDLARRDFTINAMAYHPNYGIIDYFGGNEHIRQRLICSVGDGNVRFKEDALRILRGLRFASVLGFSIEENTKKAMFGNRHLIKSLSKERIAAELLKLICGKDTWDVLNEFSSVFELFICPFSLWKDNSVLINNLDPQPYLRLCGLLYNIYPANAQMSAVKAKDILSTLKLNNHTINLIHDIISYHDIPLSSDRTYVKHILCIHTKELVDSLILFKKALCRAQNHDIGEILSFESVMEDVLLHNECYSLGQLNINGDDLVQLGIKGKAIGEILKAVLRLVINEEIPNRKNILVDEAKRIFGVEQII